jgi:hypothetical protein
MKLLVAALVLALVIACASSQPVATQDATPSPTVTASSPSASPSPTAAASNNPVPVGSPVPQQVLPPATERPVGQLCSTPIQVFANGNAGPLLCRGGEVNVQAWRHYADVSNTVLGLGQNPTQGQVEGALCADMRLNHATAPIERSGYQLAKAYYGWSFVTDPTNVMYKSPPCSQ